MNIYAIALFLHITGAIGIFLGLGMEGVILKNLRLAVSNIQAKNLAGSMKIMRIVFALSATLLLLPGLYLVGESWGWTSWVITGIILLFALSGFGSMSGKKIAGVVESLNNSSGPVPEEAKSKLSDPFLLKAYKIRMTVAAGIVFIMTLKLEWIGSIVAILIAFAVGFLISLPSTEKAAGIEQSAEEA